MECPFCHLPDTKVIDTRYVAEGNQVRRRRECVGENCSKRFTTYEKPELTMPTVIKHDGRFEKFDDMKLRKGILRAVEKLPITIEEIEGTIDHITSAVRACGEREISTTRIGKMVMDELQKLNEIAYVRFASVYRRFQNLEAFDDAIQKLKNKTTTADENDVVTEHEA